VNVLDENILESQRLLLKSWRVPVRQIGLELSRNGMSDEQILPFLLTVRQPTFFTRDLGFWSLDFRHDRRCLVVLAIGQYEVAYFVRRLLRHPMFDAHVKRMGRVFRVMPTGVLVLEPREAAERLVRWQEA
jgi:hypothetical protein